LFQKIKGEKAMPRFIASHTMQMTEEQVISMRKNTPAPPKGLSWNLSYFDFKDGKVFCEWQAPNKETIEEYFKTIKMPFDAVYPVRLYNVAKNKFEDKA
jgi:hypothetical protein